MLSLTDIFAARRRINDTVRRTPLVRSDWLSTAIDANVYLKLESLQLTGSFKIRGALNAVRALVERHGAVRPPGSPTRGLGALGWPPVVTASAGNHGRALAYAAAQVGLPLTVFAPRTAPRAKLDHIARHGADLRLAADYDEAERLAKAMAARGEATFISAYSDPDVIAGAGTVAIEIFEDCPEIDLLVIPVGGGGLASGIAVAAHAIAPAAEIAGVEVEASHVFHDSLAAGRLVEVQVGTTLADGLAGNADPDTITFDYIQRLIARIVLVGEADLRSAIRELAGREHVIVEGAGAVGVAALASRRLRAAGRHVAVILSGANIDPDTLRMIFCAAELS